jgi:hypothetical protein
MAMADENKQQSEEKTAEETAKTFDRLSESYRATVTREIRAFEAYLTKKLGKSGDDQINHRP